MQVKCHHVEHSILSSYDHYSAESQSQIHAEITCNSKYNQSLNGVDRADQNSVYYSLLKRAESGGRSRFFLAS